MRAKIDARLKWPLDEALRLYLEDDATRDKSKVVILALTEFFVRKRYLTKDSGGNLIPISPLRNNPRVEILRYGSKADRGSGESDMIRKPSVARSQKLSKT